MCIQYDEINHDLNYDFFPIIILQTFKKIAGINKYVPYLCIEEKYCTHGDSIIDSLKRDKLKSSKISLWSKINN